MADLDPIRVKLVKDPPSRWGRIEAAVKGPATVIGLVISIFSAGLAAYSASVSTKSYNGAQQIAAQNERRSALNTRFEARQSAMVRYLEANARFYAVVETIRAHLPMDIEERSVAERLSRGQLLELERVTEPVLAAADEFDAEVYASLGIWPTSIRQKMLIRNQLANAITRCFITASARALDEKEAAEMRSRLVDACHPFGEADKAFRNSRGDLVSDMATAIRSDQDALGLEPEKLLSESKK